MDSSRSCCHDLPGSLPVASPFNRVIAFGYNDGPTDGWARCSGCGREYRFGMLDSDEDADIRIFRLAPIPTGSIDRFSRAMSRFQAPSGPNWVPAWSFPTEEDRMSMESLVDAIEAEAGEGESLIATSSWPSGEILAARRIGPEGLAGEGNWFATLGILRPSIGG